MNIGTLPVSYTGTRSNLLKTKTMTLTIFGSPENRLSAYKITGTNILILKHFWFIRYYKIIKFKNRKVMIAYLGR